MDRLVMTTLACLISCECVLAKVNIKLEEQPFAIETSSYSARVERDGCLTKFAPGGMNFLAPGVSVSRGAYFFQGKTLNLPNFERPEESVIVASGDLATVRYEFAEMSLTMRLANKSEAEMVFFVVFNGYVGEVSINEGPLQKTALTGEFSEASFFMGKQKLKIDGFDKLWGPWQGPHQVVQTTLPPGAKKTVTFKAGSTNEQERLQILKLNAVPPPQDLTITSPREYQVIQRETAQRGRVLISGRTEVDATGLEIRLIGDELSPQQQEWQRVEYSAQTHQFSQWMNVPAGGWYTLEARAIDRQRMPLASGKVDHFGVGEVFVGAGQSNSTNSGQFKTQQTTGMVSSFSGTHWQIADDPQPGVADRTQGGSFWPAFGDKMYQELGVPIGVATTGFGGTSVNNWQPDGDLFQGWMLKRINQLGPQGFRAVLWHQGESDVGMPSAEYYEKLKNTILASTQQAGWEFPWFVAQASYHNAKEPSFENVRSAQRQLWEKGIALQGPDTDVLTGDHRDLDGKGIHLSPKGLKAHGEMWADHTLPYVRKSLNTAPE
ncbi:MAG: sialate O-acetylesterase [Lacipirellulaceae bacterium]